ncbi:fucose permease [Arthrobacter sp. RIT-PI-e]|uniref:MFS transporter n=1 Tax=Arthrobacter sp. RIT-PI-e TaxID=1681197 RepID=UPI000675CFD1|nr:fucose permease [Arthrobacter sp. RIT-PI-e]
MVLARPTQPAPPRDASRARVAVSVLFFTNGAIFASILPRYPEIKDALGLTNTAFGAAVAAYPLGALLAGLTAGVLIRRYRSSRVAIVSTFAAAAGILLAATSPSWAILASGLFIAGAMDSITDVAQNSHGLRVQKLYKRSILNSFHAVWSIGAVIGGAFGALAAGLGAPLALHLGVTAIIFSLAAAGVYRLLLTGPEPHHLDASTDTQTDTGYDGNHAEGSTDRKRAGTTGKYAILAALVIIASSGALVEDAGSSWAAIYLSGSLAASSFVAGLGFIALQGMQFIGRLFGDRLVDRFGQRLIARIGGIIVLIGMGAALLLPSIPSTIIGFGLAGLGVATLIPAAMQAADELPGFRTGAGLTILSWLLRVGFLVSPPVVGAIADTTELRYGLLVVPLAGLFVIVLARVLTTREHVE